ncbi:MAG: carbohydrate binding domain-containing protein [Bacteroidota bacterium]
MLHNKVVAWMFLVVMLLGSHTPLWAQGGLGQEIQLPAPPVLIQPALRAADVPTSPTFAWGVAANAESYHLQVSTWPDFSTLTLDETGIVSTSFTPPFLFADGTTYFWRVRSVNSIGESRWEPAVSGWVFTTVTGSLSPPTPISPPFEAVDVPLIPTFVWNESEGATGYHLQISNSYAFDVVLFELAGIPGTSFTLPGPLPPGMLFFWRIRAISDGGTSLWSPTITGWPFVTTASMMAPPTMLLPAENAQGVSVTPLFVWSSVPGATTYDLEIGMGPLLFEAPAQFYGLPDTVFTLPVPLENATTYYWRIRANSASGSSAWTAGFSGRSFTTELSSLQSPNPISPVDGTVGVPKTPTLTWSSVEGAAWYDLQVVSPQFIGGTGFAQQGIPDTVFTVPPGALNGGVLFNWRVRAVGPAGNSLWAPSGDGWSFVTTPDQPVPPLLFIPANGAVDQARHIVLSWWNNTDAIASAFHVQVATDPAFNALVVDLPQVPRTEVELVLDLSTTYYWRVRGINTSGIGDWSDIWTFATGLTSLIPPRPLSPGQGATNAPLIPTFTWESSPGATSYQLQVSTLESFNLEWLLTVNELGIPGNTYQPPVPLRRATEYFWRVRAMNGVDTSLWSPLLSARTFTTIQPAPPAPVLDSPPYGTDGVSVTPTLVWHHAIGALFYGIEIATDPDFVNIVGAYCGVYGNYFTLPDPLSGTTTYYWRMNATNSGGTSVFSEIWKFTTGASTPEPPSILEQPEDQIVLVGQTATFLVKTRGTGPLSFQWLRNGLEIPDAIGPVFKTPIVAEADEGARYHCVVTNVHGVARSDTALVQLTTAPRSVVENSGFESGRDPWVLFTDGVADYSTDVPGYGSSWAARVSVVGEGTNVQLYQSEISLEPNTLYELSFKGRSKWGHDVQASVHKHTCPYPSYGLTLSTFDLDTVWNSYSVVFRTSGFSVPVHDGRLSLYLADHDAAGDAFEFDDVVLVKATASEEIQSLVQNAGFEAGIDPWFFATNGTASFDVDAPSDVSMHAAHVTVYEEGTNVQLSQAGLNLESNTLYKLSFKAYSTTGHDLTVSIHEDSAPHRSLGLSEREFDLSYNWETFAVIFTTPDLSGFADGRLRFWLAPYDEAGDEYFIDNVVLEAIGNPKESAGSLLANHGFEEGTAEWVLYTDGEARLLADGPGDGTPTAGHVVILSEGSNTQLYQPGVALEPLTSYILTFKAYSSRGADLSVSLMEHAAPFASYGLDAVEFDLGRSWGTFSIPFTTPAGLAGDGRLQFWLASYSTTGEHYYFDDILLQKVNGASPSVSGPETAVGESSALPVDYILSGNYPNPFNPTTTISFGLPEPSEVTLKVYSVLGQEVATLVEGTRQAGYSQVVWNVKNYAGSELSSGVYFYRLTAVGISGKTFVDQRKMLLLR